jgi:hypothetical protein
MLYTMRTFSVQRADYREFIRISEEELWPAIGTLGARPLALWVVRAGTIERILLITRYRDMQHWLGTRDWTPEGAAAMKPSVTRRNALIRDTDLVTLESLSKREPREDADPAVAGMYALESWPAPVTGSARLADLAENAWWPWAERDGVRRYVAMWKTDIAPEARIYALSRYRDMAHWSASRTPGPEPAAGPERDRWARATDALLEMQAIAKFPLVQILEPVTVRRP